jgi:hypothetical protein
VLPKKKRTKDRRPLLTGVVRCNGTTAKKFEKKTQARFLMGTLVANQAKMHPF